MIYLMSVYLVLSYLGFSQLHESVGLYFPKNFWRNFQLFLFKYYFSLTLSFLSFWDFNESNVSSFVIVP